MSLPFTVLCSQCKSQLKVSKASLIGKKIPCPKCQTVNTLTPPTTGKVSDDEWNVEDDSYGDMKSDDIPLEYSTLNPKKKKESKRKGENGIPPKKSGFESPILWIGAAGLCVMVLVCLIVFQVMKKGSQQADTSQANSLSQSNASVAQASPSEASQAASTSSSSLQTVQATGIQFQVPQLWIVKKESGLWRVVVEMRDPKSKYPLLLSFDRRTLHRNETVQSVMDKFRSEGQRTGPNIQTNLQEIKVSGFDATRVVEKQVFAAVPGLVKYTVYVPFEFDILAIRIEESVPDNVDPFIPDVDAVIKSVIIEYPLPGVDSNYKEFRVQGATFMAPRKWTATYEPGLWGIHLTMVQPGGKAVVNLDFERYPYPFPQDKTASQVYEEVHEETLRNQDHDVSERTVSGQKSLRIIKSVGTSPNIKQYEVYVLVSDKILRIRMEAESSLLDSLISDVDKLLTTMVIDAPPGG